MHCITGANTNSAQCKYVPIQSNLWIVYRTNFWNVSYCQQLQHVVLFRNVLTRTIIYHLHFTSF